MIHRLARPVAHLLLPESTRHVLRRRAEDFAPSLAWSLAARRRMARRELAQCRSIRDYMGFATRHLGVGAVQSISEIEAALRTLQNEAPRRVCEIGTEHGGTNFLLAQMLPSLETLIGVDLYVKHKARLHTFKPAGTRLFLLDGSSYHPNTVARVESILEGQKLDVLFIDGDHRYAGVRDDFLSYRHLVRDGGAILFHDIVPDHQARFGRATTSWAGGVPLLWHRIKAFYPHQEFIEGAEQDGLGIGLLRYNSNVTLPTTFLQAEDDPAAYAQLSFTKTCGR
jgi:cephalosporin hydroxylase